MDEQEIRRRARVGAIETIVATVVGVALLAFVVWFLFFAKHPLLH
ncbi:MAG TPA: hypothetical protein VH025_07500 [Solirubrobacteraceae bacterium]|jgi:hypothetical protein|nr:hypothetical protein [Solirubrobacteraceae bacterium]